MSVGLQATESSDFFAPVEPQGRQTGAGGGGGLAILDDFDLPAASQPSSAAAKLNVGRNDGPNPLDSNDDEDDDLGARVRMMRAASSTHQMKGDDLSSSSAAQPKAPPPQSFELEPPGAGAGEKSPLRHTPLRTSLKSIPSQLTASETSQAVLTGVSTIPKNESSISETRHNMSFGVGAAGYGGMPFGSAAPAVAMAASAPLPSLRVKANNSNVVLHVPITDPAGGLQTAALYDEHLGYPYPRGHSKGKEWNEEPHGPFCPFFGPPVRASAGHRKPSGPPRSVTDMSKQLAPPQRQQPPPGAAMYGPGGAPPPQMTMMMVQGQQPLIAGHQNMMMAQPQQQQQQPLRHPPLAAAAQQQQQYVPAGMHPNQAALLASLGMISASNPEVQFVKELLSMVTFRDAPIDVEAMLQTTVFQWDVGQILLDRDGHVIELLLPYYVAGKLCGHEQLGRRLPRLVKLNMYQHRLERPDFSCWFSGVAECSLPPSLTLLSIQPADASDPFELRIASFASLPRSMTLLDMARVHLRPPCDDDGNTIRLDALPPTLTTLSMRHGGARLVSDITSASPDVWCASLVDVFLDDVSCADAPGIAITCKQFALVAHARMKRSDSLALSCDLVRELCVYTNEERSAEVVTFLARLSSLGPFAHSLRPY